MSPRDQLPANPEKREAPSCVLAQMQHTNAAHEHNQMRPDACAGIARANSICLVCYLSDGGARCDVAVAFGDAIFMMFKVVCIMLIILGVWLVIYWMLC